MIRKVRRTQRSCNASADGEGGRANPAVDKSHTVSCSGRPPFFFFFEELSLFFKAANLYHVPSDESLLLSTDGLKSFFVIFFRNCTPLSSLEVFAGDHSGAAVLKKLLCPPLIERQGRAVQKFS